MIDRSTFSSASNRQQLWRQLRNRLTLNDLALARVLKMVHVTVLAAGVGAILVVGVVAIQPEFIPHFQSSVTASSASDLSIEAIAPQLSSPLLPTFNSNFKATQKTELPSAFWLLDDSSRGAYDRQQQRVTEWLAKRYRVASAATGMLVNQSYAVAADTKLDPLLILAVMAIESGFNPFAESPLGAQGLMQVMSKIHQEKFHQLGGVKAALNPIANIKVGALILKDYVTRTGSVEAGLKQYVGAAAFETDFGYGARVVAEYQRLKDVAAGKSVPVIVNASAPVLKPRTAEPNDLAVPHEPIKPEIDAAITAPLQSIDTGSAHSFIETSL